jgi:hypothetical protein
VTHHGETDKHDEDRGDDPTPDHGDGSAVWEVVEDGAGDGRYHSPIIIVRRVWMHCTWVSEWSHMMEKATPKVSSLEKDRLSSGR